MFPIATKTNIMSVTITTPYKKQIKETYMSTPAATNVNNFVIFAIFYIIKQIFVIEYF